ncbi:MAG TPA: GIY-YIG nuclease family protein [Candidatus Paceibacterota bacterium]|nr:GIY-YIG nuclease family protein [Candidatus Paceibacterota bacterium]
MVTKEKILEEIKRTAKENNGVPLGTSRFEQATGIKPHEWSKYYARFGDAQKDAGFSPNQLQGSYPEDFLIAKIIELIRKLGKFPTSREIQVARNSVSDFPDASTFRRFGTKEQFVTKIAEYCKNKGGYDDVIGICNLILEKIPTKDNFNDKENSNVSGEVYLFKSGKYYKIGKTIDTVRRGTELRIQLPEKIDLIHSIKTDDPSGIEAYWHKRFDSKRMNGEWFDLGSSDVKAFKRWKRID